MVLHPGASMIDLKKSACVWRVSLDESHKAGADEHKGGTR